VVFVVLVVFWWLACPPLGVRRFFAFLEIFGDLEIFEDLEVFEDVLVMCW